MNKLVYEVEKKLEKKIHKAIESLSIQFSSSNIACILKERENFRIANFHPFADFKNSRINKYHIQLSHERNAWIILLYIEEEGCRRKEDGISIHTKGRDEGLIL